MIREIFLLRSVACLCVVLIHSASIMINKMYEEADASLEKGIWTSLLLLLMFATPLFVFISEFLISYSRSVKSPKTFLWKRIKFILFPFIAMAVFYAFLTSITGQHALSEFGHFLWQNLILGKFHGYFILIIFQFYLLHVLFQRYGQGWSWKWVLAVSLLVNVAYLGYFSFVRTFDDPHSEYQAWWLPFLGWIFYFTSGYYCGRYFDQVKSALITYRRWIWAATLLLACMMLFLHHSGLITIMSSKRVDVLLYAIGMIFSLFAWAVQVKRVPRILVAISQYSFSIYLLHIFFLMCVSKLFSMLFPALHQSLLFLVALFVGGVCLSWGAAYVLQKLPFHEYLIGKLGKALPREEDTTINKKAPQGRELATGEQA
ncbi:acyltransferase family protein [Brevibacillus reuszeri]|uniref:acyltransferase family protein n=1 Tax=Brevibacillus reuszeri TaxID=54915 RepID=UPI0028A135DF|nr:acyltransferase family protein [Brevibacillus reuszeri]